MHELALTEKIFRIVLTEAEAHQARQVNKIKIAVGELSGVVESSVEFYFQLLAKDTIAKKATMEFTKLEAKLFCPQCNREFPKQSRDFLCPNCGNLARLTDNGQECIVQSIEVD